jgi:hypothetical protein
MATKPKAQRRQETKETEAQTKAASRGAEKVADPTARPRAKVKTADHKASKSKSTADHSSARKSVHGANGHESTARRRSPRTESSTTMLKRLFEALELHATSSRLGHVAADAQFDWGEEIKSPELRPDLAFVSFDRWAAYRTIPQQLTWHVVPDLVVEIRRSSSHQAEERTRLEDYFRAGVGRVWIVDPAHVKIHDHDSPTSSHMIDRHHSIDGGDILPGFSYPVAQLAAKQEQPSEKKQP